MHYILINTLIYYGLWMAMVTDALGKKNAIADSLWSKFHFNSLCLRNLKQIFTVYEYIYSYIYIYINIYKMSMYSIKDSVFNIYLLWLLYLQFKSSDVGQGWTDQGPSVWKQDAEFFWQTVSLFNLTLFLYGEIKFDLFPMSRWCLFIVVGFWRE